MLGAHPFNHDAEYARDPGSRGLIVFSSSWHPSQLHTARTLRAEASKTWYARTVQGIHRLNCPAATLQLLKGVHWRTNRPMTTITISSSFPQNGANYRRNPKNTCTKGPLHLLFPHLTPNLPPPPFRQTRKHLSQTLPRRNLPGPRALPPFAARTPLQLKKLLTQNSNT